MIPNSSALNLRIDAFNNYTQNMDVNKNKNILSTEKERTFWEFNSSISDLQIV